MIMRVSEIDGATMVLEVEHGDEGPVVERLSQTGHGFAVFGPDLEMPMAVVDGRLRTEEWCTEDHVLAIEAHELGHILEETCDEPTAEWAAIKMLEKTGRLIAAGILRERGVV